MIRAWLARMVGPTPGYRAHYDAFMEGYRMACEIDPLQCAKHKVSPGDIKRATSQVRTYSTASDAWFNSDTQEKVRP